MMPIFNPSLIPSLLWLMAALVLCLMEAIFPTAFVALIMGISAGFVALIALFVPQFPLQVVLWLVFSTFSIIISRRFFTPKQKFTSLGDDQEGEILSILEGENTLRVLYEGNSWRAKCADDHIPLSPGETVYIVGKKGTTLIVLPKKYGD